MSENDNRSIMEVGKVEYIVMGLIAVIAWGIYSFLFVHGKMVEGEPPDPLPDADVKELFDDFRD